MNDDNGDWAVYLLAAILLTIIVIMFCGCDRVTPTDRAPGMPLDACTVVEYDRPVWLPDCTHAYKVYDRQTGDAWWLLYVGKNAGYVVLPLDEKDR